MQGSESLRRIADDSSAARTIPMTLPMTLGNIRENGAGSIWVSCCGAIIGVLSAAPWLEDFPVPRLGPRMVCIGCETVGADAQPNWKEQAL
jgi:hypothetical protein